MKRKQFNLNLRRDYMVLDFDEVLGEILGYKVRVKKSDYYVLRIFHLLDIDTLEEFKEYFKVNRFNIVDCKKFETKFEEWYDVIVKVKDYKEK